MRKISWLAILLIGGCTLILEQSNLVSLNDSLGFRLLDERVFIRSCRQLKEESYDIFYAAENQKCLEENAKQMQRLSEQIEQTNDLIKKEKLLDDVLASSEKFDACKISKRLTVADLLNNLMTALLHTGSVIKYSLILPKPIGFVKTENILIRMMETVLLRIIKLWRDKKRKIRRK